MAYFQIRQDVAGDWRFRFTGDNHEIIASGEGYTTRQSCEWAIHLLKAQAAQAPVLEQNALGVFGSRRAPEATVLGNALLSMTRR